MLPFSSKRRGSDDGAGCGCGLLSMLVIMGLYASLPGGTFSTFVSYFVSIFLGFNFLFLYLESKINMGNRVRQKSGIDIAISNEKCLEYIEFQKLIAKLKPEKFNKKVTKSSVIELGRSLKEFDSIYAFMLAREECINAFGNDFGNQASIKKELAKVRKNQKNTQNDETRENLLEREEALLSKLEQVKSIDFARKQLKIKRKLVKDTLEDIFLKMKNLEVGFDSKSSTIEKDLKEKLEEAQVEVEILEKAIDKVI